MELTERIQELSKPTKVTPIQHWKSREMIYLHLLFSWWQIQQREELSVALALKEQEVAKLKAEVSEFPFANIAHVDSRLQQ